MDLHPEHGIYDSIFQTLTNPDPTDFDYEIWWIPKCGSVRAQCEVKCDGKCNQTKYNVILAGRLSKSKIRKLDKFLKENITESSASYRKKERKSGKRHPFVVITRAYHYGLGVLSSIGIDIFNPATEEHKLILKKFFKIVKRPAKAEPMTFEFLQENKVIPLDFKRELVVKEESVNSLERSNRFDLISKLFAAAGEDRFCGRNGRWVRVGPSEYSG